MGFEGNGAATIVLTLTMLLVGLLLYVVDRRYRPRFEAAGERVVEQINAELPQTQCGQCNYAGCRPYAEAIAAGEANINQCPPGGEATIDALAVLLGREAMPLNPENGIEAPAKVAYIHEDLCIGCKKCILACPVDAIVGAPKLMHTVIASSCTGCDLCVEPCPVDCIDMIDMAVTPTTWRTERPAAHG
ncbi:MAG: electron transport complex subunit RsxB [Pseudomonadota bacterium]